jgi:hypothetical protein
VTLSKPSASKRSTSMGRLISGSAMLDWGHATMRPLPLRRASSTATRRAISVFSGAAQRWPPATSARAPSTWRTMSRRSMLAGTPTGPTTRLAAHGGRPAGASGPRV